MGFGEVGGEIGRGGPGGPIFFFMGEGIFFRTRVTFFNVAWWRGGGEITRRSGGGVGLFWTPAGRVPRRNSFEPLTGAGVLGGFLWGGFLSL